MSTLHHNNTLQLSYTAIEKDNTNVSYRIKKHYSDLLFILISSRLSACVLSFQAVGQRFRFGVRCSETEGLARRHRSNIGGWERRASTPAPPGWRRRTRRRGGRGGRRRWSSAATLTESGGCVFSVGRQVRAKLVLTTLGCVQEGRGRGKGRGRRGGVSGGGGEESWA